jgi:hypothetical protein
MTTTRRAISGKGGSEEERSGSSQPSGLFSYAGPCFVSFCAGPCFLSEEERAVGAGLPVCVMSRVSGVLYGMCRLPLCTCSTRDFYSKEVGLSCSLLGSSWLCLQPCEARDRNFFGKTHLQGGRKRKHH